MNKIKLNDEKSSYVMTEQLKSLRTSIQFCGDDKKVIMVTSCLPGEGKSSFVVNIAKVFAELNKSVLVIDADMRKSVMASRVLETGGQEKGLSHFLTGQCALRDAVCATDIPRMHMLFAGPVPPNPSELLGSARFQTMLESFRKVYDYIFIDTSPIGMVTDAAIIAAKSDGVVFIIEKGRVKKSLLASAKARIEETGCPILGAVLNKVDRQHRKGYYGKEYKYEKYGEE